MKISLKINQSLYFAAHHLEYISCIIRIRHLIPVNLIQFIKWAKYDGSDVATCRLRSCCCCWLLLQNFDFFISRRIISHCSRCYRQTYFPWQCQALRLSWRNWPLRQGLGPGCPERVMWAPFLSRRCFVAPSRQYRREMIFLSQLFRCTVTEITLRFSNIRTIIDNNSDQPLRKMGYQSSPISK